MPVLRLAALSRVLALALRGHPYAMMRMHTQCHPTLPLTTPHHCSAATVRATTPARVLCCTRADFDRHLGSLGEIRNMWRFEALRKVGCICCRLSDAC